MKLLKLIPATAIVLTAFTTFEAKAGYPSGYTKKNSCTNVAGDRKYYKLQKTDEPASYGVYEDKKNCWHTQYVDYDTATELYKIRCDNWIPGEICSSQGG